MVRYFPVGEVNLAVLNSACTHARVFAVTHFKAHGFSLERFIRFGLGWSFQWASFCLQRKTFASSFAVVHQWRQVFFRTVFSFSLPFNSYFCACKLKLPRLCSSVHDVFHEKITVACFPACFSRFALVFPRRKCCHAQQRLWVFVVVQLIMSHINCLHEFHLESIWCLERE